MFSPAKYLLALLMPDINAGRKPDIKKLAQKAGVDVEAAREIVQQLTDRLGPDE